LADEEITEDVNKEVNGEVSGPAASPTSTTILANSLEKVDPTHDVNTVSRHSYYSINVCGLYFYLYVHFEPF